MCYTEPRDIFQSKKDDAPNNFLVIDSAGGRKACIVDEEAENEWMDEWMNDPMKEWITKDR